MNSQKFKKYIFGNLLLLNFLIVDAFDIVVKAIKGNL